ncbi:MAG: oligopeptide transport system permease protein [Gammaproteobacteria bacterium]|nr:oligopeptide transport system permease protein [Gammaproteobacteria bacterium]
MLRYAVRRIAGLIPTLLVIITASFFIVRLAPGGPFDQEQTLSREVRANLDRAYGLDQPMVVQYGRYLRALAHGDFGPSFKQRDFSVTELIAQGLPVSGALGLTAIVLALTLGIALGVAAAVWRQTSVDVGITSFVVLGIALPGFVVGPLLALIFGVYLQWLPVAGWDGGAPRYFVLPALTLALPVIAYVTRLTRSSLLDVFRANFIRTARARGVGGWRILWGHALRPALLPVVSYIGPATAFVVTGSLVVETVFGLPGTGRYLVQGAINRDYTLVMGMVIVYGTLVLLLNLIADLVYGWLDPRVRHE